MSLPQLVHILFTRQRRVFVVVFLACVAAAVAITATMPKEYRAKATLFVGENRPISTGANAVQLDQVLSQTYAKLLDSQEVGEEVVRALPFHTTVHQLFGKVSFSVINGTRLIEIDATDRKARRAQQVANTYARVFVESQQNSATNASQARLNALNRRIGALVVEIQSLEGQTAPDAVARREQAKNELSAARASFSATEQNNALQGSNVTVATHARAPRAAFKPRPKLYIGLGILLGLILAAAAALLRDVFDRRVRDEEELAALLPAPIIATIPLRRGPTQDPHLAEAFQLLRANLQLSDPEHETRLIAATSALPGDGKTTIVRRLASALAATGAEVVAADCDLRKPRLAASFGIEAELGITSVLLGHCSLEEAEIPLESGVRLVPSGPIPPDPAVMLSMPAFVELIDQLGQSADYVLIDTPPVTAGADASAVAAQADGVLIVVDLAKSRRDAIAAAREQLLKSDTRLLGVVLNRVPDSQSPYAYYYSSEGSRQRTADGDRARRRVET